MSETTDKQNSESKPQPRVAHISLNDIDFTLKVLQLAVKRGAFELAELKNVGTLGDRLMAFLKANAPAPPVDEETQQKKEDGDIGKTDDTEAEEEAE